MNTKREWRDIQGSNGAYRISDDGKVYSVARLDITGRNKLPGKRMKVFAPKRKDRPAAQTKYMYVTLRLNGSTKLYQVHRLVALAFIPNPDNKPQVNHKDGNPANNSVLNLDWMTASENKIHSVMVLGRGRGERINKARLKSADIPRIRALRGLLDHPELGRCFGVSASAIYSVLHRRTWKHIA